MVGEKNKIIKIDDMEFIINNGFKLDIYNKDGQNFVRYNGDRFKISNEYSIPNLDSSQVPISFEGGHTSVNIRVNPTMPEGVVFVDNKMLEGGDSEKVRVSDKPSTVSLRYLKSNIKQVLRVSIKSEDGEVVNKNKHDVEDRFVSNKMYTDDSEGIKTFTENETVNKSSEKKIYTDLDIIPDRLDVDYLEFIGCGSYRNVYDVLDNSMMGLDQSCVVVVKIATNKNGVVSNKREVETWSTVRGTDLQKYFCPIVDRGPDFKYLVMKKVGNTLLDSDKSVEERREVKDMIESDIKNKIDEETIQTPTTQSMDITASNTGEILDNWVLIDYPYGGNFQYIND